jgi:hypothetical protein
MPQSAQLGAAKCGPRLLPIIEVHDPHLLHLRSNRTDSPVIEVDAAVTAEDTNKSSCPAKAAAAVVVLLWSLVEVMVGMTCVPLNRALHHRPPSLLI